MKIARVLGVLAVLLLAGAARAAIPDYALDRDYKNCVGDDNDPQRAAYCNCVRDGMRGWSENDYAQIASEQAANANTPGAIPSQIADLAKACIEKVLH